MVGFDQRKYQKQGYSVSVPEGCMFQGDNGSWYCSLNDGQEFSLLVEGPTGTRAIFELYIQGTPMHQDDKGRQLIVSFDEIPCQLFRPTFTDQSFQFFKTYSKMGEKLGISQMNPHDRGLVKIIMKPEIKEVYRGTTKGLSSGAAALSGKATGQEFGSTSKIQQTGNPVEFMFRLVCEESLPPTLIQDNVIYPKPLD